MESIKRSHGFLNRIFVPSCSLFFLYTSILTHDFLHASCVPQVAGAPTDALALRSVFPKQFLITDRNKRLFFEATQEARGELWATWQFLQFEMQRDGSKMTACCGSWSKVTPVPLAVQSTWPPAVCPQGSRTKAPIQRRPGDMIATSKLQKWWCWNNTCIAADHRLNSSWKLLEESKPKEILHLQFHLQV